MDTVSITPLTKSDDCFYIVCFKKADDSDISNDKITPYVSDLDYLDDHFQVFLLIVQGWRKHFMIGQAIYFPPPPPILTHTHAHYYHSNCYNLKSAQIESMNTYLL